jgi:hypothetical protein
LARSFNFFLLVLEARSALPRQLLIDTCPPATFSVALRQCRRKIHLGRSPVTGTWCPSASGLSVVQCACGSRTVFFWPISAVSGRLASVLRLGGAGVSAWPSRAAVRLLGPFPLLPATCFGWFSASMSCVFFSLFLGHSLLLLSSNFMGIFVG